MPSPTEVWVCICNEVTDRTIKTLTREGLGVDDIMLKTRCSMTCGRCYDTLLEIVENEKASDDSGTGCQLCAGLA
jgi:bacterioferritin-associated ferredoxin